MRRSKAERRSSWHRFEELEPRLALAVGVYTFHNDTANTGLYSNETLLNPANVRTATFGKLFNTPVDGQIYAQPLLAPGINITSGPNTTAGSTGVHDVALAATQHNSLYAIDASRSGDGDILWHRSFTNIASSYTGSTPGTNINNTLGASAISSVPEVDTNSTDITPEIGITGTPVIDPDTNTLFVAVKTKETIGGVSHWVQRLHAINLSNGTDRVAPYLIGDTRGSNTNNTAIYVYGNGDGSVVDPYNNTGEDVVQFHALRQNQRAALSLVNDQVYVSWASHGDEDPYHGWVARWDVSNLSTDGLELSGVLNVSPNGGRAGIWQGAGPLGFEADGSAFYFGVGNGPADATNPTLDANGFPVDGNYYEALVRAENDPTSDPTDQHINGWGMKVVDYFMPYNQAFLDAVDRDFGSGAPLILPDSAGIPGHPHLLVVGAKEGKVYVMDRDNLGKFDANGDHVLNAAKNSDGIMTPPKLVNGVANALAYYNGAVYVSPAFRDTARSVTVNYNGMLSQNSRTTAALGLLIGSPVISSSGTIDGIAWIMDRNLNLIRAYDASDFATELWNSGQAANNADSLGLATKFGTPIVANGQVFVGTLDKGLVVYGLDELPNAAPQAPVLSTSVQSSAAIKLKWTDSSSNPNAAHGYIIQRSTDNVNFTQVATLSAGTAVVTLGGLNPSTKYYFRIRGFNDDGNSSFSNVASATTRQFNGLDLSAGFYDSTNKLAYNGAATIYGGRARLTNLGLHEGGSVFSKDRFSISSFNTQFTLQFSSGSSTADGMTFTIQGNNPTTKGGSGGSLGYAGIKKSVAVKFDINNNSGEGANSTGLYINGAAPTNIGSVNLSSNNIDFHSGHIFQVNMTYNGTQLAVTIQDKTTGATATQTYNVNIPSIVGSTTGYVGFTAGTGARVAKQDIRTWTFSPGTATVAAAPLNVNVGRTTLSDPQQLPTTLVDEAIADWALHDVSIALLQRMRETQWEIADLPGSQLGLAMGNKVFIDHNAAGYGWFIDPTPRSNEEFQPDGATGDLRAVDPRALSRVDLLTVVAHELGHVAGLGHAASFESELMSPNLSVGIRRTL